MEQNVEASSKLAIRITSETNKQTYYTIRLLVDRDRIANAFRAYAYFRWVDDWLDCGETKREDRLTFIARQQAVMECAYEGVLLPNLSVAERMLADLIRSDQDSYSGLGAYIRNMMAVMAFDAHRRGRLASQDELSHYTQHLAVAVTEALLYFIGHERMAPPGEARYMAVIGAHVTHMLRDAIEDSDAGYFNVPC